jgi:hypothetical protein
VVPLDEHGARTIRELLPPQQEPLKNTDLVGLGAIVTPRPLDANMSAETAVRQVVAGIKTRGPLLAPTG